MYTMVWERDTPVHIIMSATVAKSTRFLIGRVIGTKMRKTAKVCVTRMTLHPHVLKYVSKRKTVFAHDEEEECKDGDLVMIGECQRISNQKHFKVWRILEKADSYTDPNTGKTHYRTPYWFADADH